MALRSGITDLKIKIDQLVKEKIRVTLEDLSEKRINEPAFEIEMDNLSCNIMRDTRMKEYIREFILEYEYVEFFVIVSKICEMYKGTRSDIGYLKHLTKENL